MSKSFPDQDPDAVQRWQIPDVNTFQEGNDGYALPRSPVTADQIEKLQQQAYQEAWNEGVAKGLAEGKQQAELQARGQLQVISSILDQCAVPYKKMEAEAEQQLVQLAVAMARQIIRREIQTDPEQIVSVVRNAMEVLPAASSDVRIYLHPEDAATLKATLSPSDSNYWKLLEDPVMNRGDCRIHTETSSVDASVEHRLAAVVSEMLGGMRKNDNASGDTNGKGSKR